MAACTACGIGVCLPLLWHSSSRPLPRPRSWRTRTRIIVTAMKHTGTSGRSKPTTDPPSCQHVTTRVATSTCGSTKPRGRLRSTCFSVPRSRRQALISTSDRASALASFPRHPVLPPIHPATILRDSALHRFTDPHNIVALRLGQVVNRRPGGSFTGFAGRISETTNRIHLGPSAHRARVASAAGDVAAIPAPAHTGRRPRRSLPH